MEINDLEGKTLAVILWCEDENGEDEVYVRTSQIRQNNGELMFEVPDNIFDFDSNNHFLPISDYLERINVVEDELKVTLKNADYSLSLIVGNIE